MFFSLIEWLEISVPDQIRDQTCTLGSENSVLTTRPQGIP